MRARFSFLFNQRYRSLFYSILVLGLFIGGITFVNHSNAEKKKEAKDSLSPVDDPNFPTEFDSRAIHGTPRGTELIQPTAAQQKAIDSLVNLLGLSSASLLQVKYNGLTATPKHLFVRGGYLTEPSAAPPESIARNFIRANKGIFRFSETDLNSMKVTSRATHPKSGTTTLLLTQQKNGLNFFNGAVLVNVAANGQIMNVGGESYPSLEITNTSTITASQAVNAAATDLGLSGYTLNSEGSTQVLSTYGDLEPEYTTGEKFTSNGFFGDDINVTQVVFPQGSTGRIAYRFTLTTPQYFGVMWENFVDAQTGAILRRHSLTSFQKNPKLSKSKQTSNFGPTGGGIGIGRLPSYRPDVQNMVENYNAAGTAQGKVFDTIPTLLAGSGGFGRSTRISGSGPGDWMYQSPTYAAIGTTGAGSGRGFTYNMMLRRNEQALPWAETPSTFSHAQLPSLLGQITRGFPDATNPSVGSPFGWFYLPTDTGGTQITVGDNNRSATDAVGYTMSSQAITRNQVNPGNSPNGATGDQPFSADLTPLPSNVPLNDGRVLSSVFESRYTEGNAVLVADDRENNNETNHGIKGYSANRNFTAPYFDYHAFYEYDGPDAGGGTGQATTFPVSADADIFSGTSALFYFNNVLHDYLYEIGFTEQFWNFQMDNFGKGGAGGDSVSAQVQDGSGVNNANFGTPADGSGPRMQMFLFTEGSFRRSDGDYDFDVVAHELYHGVSNRSAGKGGTGCLGVALVGESGGMGEGWGDAIGASMTDDDALGEFVTGEQDIAIRRLPQANYRWSYGTVNQNVRTRRDGGIPDPSPGSTPFQVHAIGELWSSTLWDMRELLIMKDSNGTFYDGGRRLGSGANFFIGSNQVQSVDAEHPINYRASFNTTNGTTPSIFATEHIVRPGLIATENQTNPNRDGPIATAVANGARLADTLVLRGLQLTPCNPSFVDMRDSILLADQELTGGENQAIIWRSFASHGIGEAATSTGGTGGQGGTQSAPQVVEDFSVPAGVTECETLGPLAAPTFTATNTTANTASLAITNVTGATQYVIARSTNASGPFATIATIDADAGLATTFDDDDGGQGLNVGQTFHYQVHAVRNPECVGTANTVSVTINLGVSIQVAPVFTGVAAVTDTRENTTLTLNWSPAVSTSTTADIVYDVYRVESITSGSGQTDSTTTPTFTPTVGNRIAQGVNGVSYIDTGLTLGQIYYYIVQARDLDNGMIDTNNTGNVAAKFAAPTSTSVASTPFGIEDYENASANTRFTPALVDQASPNISLTSWQRVAGVDFLVGDNLAQSTVMYAPDVDPGGAGNGSPSDITTVIGPITLTETSVMEFQSRFSTEAAFDGAVLEVAVGSPTFPQVFPDNTTNYDINYFAYEGGYTGPLNGTLAGPVILSALQGRYAFDGTRPTTLTRIALGEFANGGEFNATGLPVYFRFRMTSDAGTNAGPDSGWYVDNLVINNYEAAAIPVGFEGDVSPRFNGGDDQVSATDVTQVRRFAVALDSFDPGFNEFQRADSAPIASNGNGAVTATDVVQTRRFQVGLDALIPAAGPTEPSSFFDDKGLSEDFSSSREVRVVSTKTDGKFVDVIIEADTLGDETMYGFSLEYNPKVLSNPRVSLGSAAISGQVVTNTTKDGHIGFMIDLLGRTLSPGVDRQLITIRFDKNEAVVKETTLNFSNSRAIKEVSDNSANALPVNFKDGEVYFDR